MRAILVGEKGHGRFKTYIYSCVDCGSEYHRSAKGKHINPYCIDCSRKYQRIRDEENRLKRQKEHDSHILLEYKTFLMPYIVHEMKDMCSDLNKKEIDSHEDADKWLEIWKGVLFERIIFNAVEKADKDFNSNNP